MLKKNSVMIALLLLAGILRFLLHSGVEGSDDAVYLSQAYNIFSANFQPPDYIADLRIGTILPIAMMFKLFGPNPYTIFLWPFIASLMNILIIYMISTRLFNESIARWAALCAVFFPLDMHFAGRAMTECSLVLTLNLSVLCYLIGFREEKHRILFYFLSGIFIGLAVLNKEPAILLLFFFLIHSFVYRNLPINFIYIILGGFAIFIGENIYLYLATNDPLFLYHIFTKVISSNQVLVVTRGDQSLLYYAYYAFISMQHVGLFYYIAFSGLCYALLNKHKLQTGEISGIQFLVLWGFSLIGIMTFLPISIRPLLFIPKQTNYMLIFSAPFIILTGYTLSIIQKKRMLYGLMLILFSTGLFCAYFQRNTVNSHAYNTKAAITYIQSNIKNFSDFKVVTGEANTHYLMVDNMFHTNKITYCFFDEIIDKAIKDQATYQYQRNNGDDDLFLNNMMKFEKVLVFYDTRLAERQKHKFFYPNINVFKNSEDNFKLIATIKKEKSKMEDFTEIILKNLIRKMDGIGFGTWIAKKIEAQLKDVFNPDPAYLFLKDSKTSKDGKI